MDSSRKRLLIGLAVVVGVSLIFLGGYLPGASRARNAAAESRKTTQRLAETQAALAKTQFDLEVARLRGRLGEVFHLANANNFGVAAERATPFFDALRNAVDSPHLAPAGERRNVLQSTLARRDEISADLARADPAVKAKLAEMYIAFGQAVE